MLSKEQRKKIEGAVLRSRKLLEDEFDRLLRTHGLMPEEAIERIPQEKQEVQKRLEIALRRESENYNKARRRYVKYAAFTFLNRILALRISEVHGLIKETVITRDKYGEMSRRERDLLDMHPELISNPEKPAFGALKEAYEDVGEYIPHLFDFEDPYSILRPSLVAYRNVRRIISEMPEDILRQFETIGWAYQYFNTKEKEEIRKRMRGSPQPDEIPPLNQQYTVGWIVKFLVENTLGKLWLEAKPDTRLTLDYLVQTENELKPGGIKVVNIKVLDPACGSGHFLLGAFDLLMEMWKEERPEIPAWEIPALILEKNLYGIDIDLRATQMAAMALYLKARTAFGKEKEEGEEFELDRMNIVCADIHFVDGELRRKFLSQYDYNRQVRSIVEETLMACEHAFEIGSLLRIKKQLTELFESRRKGWTKASFAQEQLATFLPKAIPKEDTVEEIVEKISVFIKEATESKDMGTQLFGFDAEKAINLVDVLTNHYDVVLMNPPYGAMPAKCKEYAKERYKRTHRDYYAAFIEQAIDLCTPGGYVGALTGRTFMFLKSHQKLREEILRRDALPEVVLDLGFNVLDGATARYAAFTLRKRCEGDRVKWEEHPVTFFKLTDFAWDEKRVMFEKNYQK